jgi:hypothetical protein
VLCFGGADCLLRLDVPARLSEGSASQVSNVSKNLCGGGRQPLRGKEKRSTDQSQKPTTKTAYAAPGDMAGLEVSPIPCTLQTHVPPDITKCRTYCLELPAFQVPCNNARIDSLMRQRTLESLQSRAGKETRATIFAALGCCRVRWISRTRMGNAGAREFDSYCKGWATLGASIPSVCLPTAG